MHLLEFNFFDGQMVTSDCTKVAWVLPLTSSYSAFLLAKYYHESTF
ncbi:hypothetical protein BCL90_1968 [Pedobacter alluvionis]|uniref:Uncharacterized protein n=1 Tax=Pedobacter alluvionis TaxID=475253 RepID=A0A497Y4H4_9SPHI|nr:hypothetical protein BCL90_1968 [Pedobacter alluvionis]